MRARIVGKYFAELNGAEAERAPACRAATLIQAAWRRHKVPFVLVSAGHGWRGTSKGEGVEGNEAPTP